MRSVISRRSWSASRDDARSWRSPTISFRGLDPGSGKELWRLPHGVDERSGYSTPVPLGGDRFLLVGRENAAAFRVEATETGFGVAEVWRTTDLKGSFATPVFFDGHVYGFNGEFLTCISAADGARVWRSRPPGGQGLIVVDGHLVILGTGGRLVVARASPKGYEELAAVQTSGGSPTYPSFADGLVFVRDTRNIAAVKIVGDARGTEPAHPDSTSP